jgi:xanthine dehydrogenase accessory factor
LKLAIVLAAGESIRMGRAKTSLPLRGKTMLGRVVETFLAAPFDRLRVVVPPEGAPDLPDDPRVEIVENEQRREGIASSIRRGLGDLPAGTEMAAIALADLPFVRVATLRRLVDTMTSEKAGIVYPTYEGQAGHPVLWHPRLFEELGELRGDCGARKVLERHREQAIAVPVEDEGVCLDIDTPADYSRAMSRRSRRTVFEELKDANQRGESVALVTILETQGSTPQKAGAKMVVGRDGRLRGTVGGGCVENEILSRARRTIETRRCKIEEFDFNADEDENGLICGGSMKVFIEPVIPSPRLFVIGGGHVGMPVAQVAKLAGFEVTVLDDRVKYANRERFPEVEVVEAGPIPALADRFDYGDNAFVVIVTRGHKEDEEALRTFIEKETAYLGLIGSVTKLQKLFRRLEKDGVSRERLDRVHSPMGLDLGGSSPGEIAVSIVAELLAVKYQRTARSMRSTDRQEFFGKV